MPNMHDTSSIIRKRQSNNEIRQSHNEIHHAPIRMTKMKMTDIKFLWQWLHIVGHNWSDLAAAAV